MEHRGCRLKVGWVDSRHCLARPFRSWEISTKSLLRPSRKESGQHYARFRSPLAKAFQDNFDAMLSLCRLLCVQPIFSY